MKKLGIFLLFFFLLSLVLVAYKSPTFNNTGRVIWKGEPHAAFTTLVYFDGFFYCAFRNANKHYDPSGVDCGVIKIIRSKDTENWEEYLIYSEPLYDLRDPQLSITPKGELMLITDRVRYVEGKAVKRNTCVSFIDQKRNKSELRPVDFLNSNDYNWIWNVEWIDGVAYGFNYTPFFAFVRSKDGITYEMIERLFLDNQPTEASLLKMSRNELFAIVRTNRNALIGIYDIKGKKWKWETCKERIDCPKVLKVNKDIYVVGRSYEKGRGITLYKYNKQARDLDCCVRIKGGKDCAYPGFVHANGQIYISYYSGAGKDTDIYLFTYKIEK